MDTRESPYLHTNDLRLALTDMPKACVIRTELDWVGWHKHIIVVYVKGCTIYHDHISYQLIVVFLFFLSFCLSCINHIGYLLANVGYLSFPPVQHQKIFLL